MFSKEIWYAVVGGATGALLAMAAGAISPLSAKNEAGDAKFERITCREIFVVSDPHQPDVESPASWITHGQVSLRGENGRSAVHLAASVDAARLQLYRDVMNSDDTLMHEVDIAVNENGGAVHLSGANNGYGFITARPGPRSAAFSGDAEFGGRGEFVGEVTVRDLNEKEIVTIGTNKYGGTIDVFSADRISKSHVSMGIDRSTHGGFVMATGKDGKAWADMGIDSHGNGMISTSDKSGKILAILGK